MGGSRRDVSYLTRSYPCAWQAPVHLFCGMWGMVASGLFATREGWTLVYGNGLEDKCCGLFYGCGFNLLGANLVLVGAIIAWVALAAVLIFYTIKVRRNATVGWSARLSCTWAVESSRVESSTFAAIPENGRTGARNSKIIVFSLRHSESSRNRSLDGCWGLVFMFVHPVKNSLFSRFEVLYP